MPPIEKQQLTRGMAAALTTAALGAATWVTATFVDLPVALLVAAAACWLGGLVGFGVLTYREARGQGIGFWRCVGRAVKQFLRALLDLLP